MVNISKREQLPDNREQRGLRLVSARSEVASVPPADLRHYGRTAEVALVHVFYTLVAFSGLLAKQTFLFLHTFLLMLWFLKLDSGSWRPEFPQQLEALSATGSWQADKQVFQFTLDFFFFFAFFFLFKLFLLPYFSYTLSFKHHIINCVHPVPHAIATALKSQ